MDALPNNKIDDRFKHLAKMYVALSATNEAILRAREPVDLYQRVCDAAIEAGHFAAAGVVIAPPGSTWVHFEAAAGSAAEQLKQARISLDPESSSGRGLVGVAYRTMAPCISNDFLADERSLPWRHIPAQSQIGSAAAVPLMQGDSAIGVLLLYASERNAFDEQVISLVERMARSIIFALHNFAQDTERKAIEEALQASEARYRNILETMENAYCEVDFTGRHIFFNTAFCNLTGHSESELKASTNRDHQTKEMARVCMASFNKVYRSGLPQTNQQFGYLHKDGSVLQLEGSVQLLKDKSGNATGFCTVLHNITARWKADQALRESEARFRALTNLSSDWYWEQDPDLRITRMESRHLHVNHQAHPLLGKLVWECGFEIQAAGGWDSLRATLAEKRGYRDVIVHRVNRNGEPYFVSMSAEPMFASDGEFSGYRGISREITEQKIAEERIRYLASHDALTALPNRLMFSHLLNVLLETSKRYVRHFAVLFIDLDRFKFINDTLGHEAGDSLLKEIAARFKQNLRASDVIARLGGDEFVVLIQEMGNHEQVAAIARKLLSAAIRPIELMGQECRVTASIGIAVYPEDGVDEQALMKNADIAMYHAKEEGKNNFQFYSTEIKSQSLERMVLESNLRYALERNELTLHYQAKVDLTTDAIAGVEALLRWDNATLGSVSPAQFIPIAEDTGLIVPIGIWVLRTACAQNASWQKQGLPPICVAVNLSVRQFADENLLSDIASVLEQTGLDPKLLELEITEGMVVHNPERAIKLLIAIKQLGVRLAIDDFGTGYSSLGQLKHFPIDTLKVDRSFIRDLATDSEDKAITNAIIAMGKTLGLTVVAEGVETLEQEMFLREHACDQMQGFYFSKPIAADAFGILMREHVPRRSPYRHEV
ncbi:MAG: EAL domain-containing protein [Herminiimonas sp.]|nr:EAL domain-containing protein [Herminiimonas sp.]